ncbi:MAG: GreA/GreB family elongation factor [Planctomycetota bacterium]
MTLDLGLQNTIETALKRSKNYDLLQFVESFGKILESDLKNAEYLFNVSKKLQKKKEANLASQLLLAMYDRFKENFREAKLPQYNLRLLQEAYLCTPQKKELRDALIEAYREVYAGRKNLELYLEKSGILEDSDLQNAIQFLELYLKYDEGSYVLQEHYNLGQVVRIDVEEGRFIIDFPGKIDPKTKKELFPSKKGHSVTARMISLFANPLPEGSFLFLFHLNLEKLQQLAKEAPQELVVMVLKDYGNRITLKQLKVLLTQDIVPQSKWTAWWKETKTVLAKDPYVSIGEGPSAVLELLDIPRSQDEDYIVRFRSGTTIPEMIEEARNIILNPNNIPGNHFKQAILQLCEAQYNQPNLPLAFRVELFLFLKENTEFLGTEVEGTIESYFTNFKQSREIIEGIHIEDYQQILLEVVKKLYPDQYLQFFGDAIFFTKRKVWEPLWKEIKKDFDLANSVISRLDALNENYPDQYQWLAKNVFERKWEQLQVPSDIRIFENLIRILGRLSILSTNTSDKKDLSDVRKILAAVKSLLTYKDCIYVSRYMEQASPEEVIYFDRLLHTKIALSETLRSTMSKPIIKRLAEMPHLLASKEAQEEVEDSTVYVTEISLKRKQDEYNHLTKVLMPQALVEIATAREHGDLSENAEYDAALEKSARCNEKEKRLRTEMQNARIINFNEINGKTITVGTDVIFENQKTKKKIKFTLLGVWDGDEDHNIISYKTPFAQKVIGKSVGDFVEFSLDKDKTLEPHEIIQIDVTKHHGERS